MKPKISVVGLAIILGACGSGPEIADPYVNLAEETLLVRFEVDENIPEGQCNPNVHYAMRTNEAAHLINANFEVVDQNITGSEFRITDDNGSGVARNTVEFDMFDPYPVPCAELQVRLQDLTCSLESEPNSQPCPNPVFEGTEMFASFSGPPGN